MSRPSEERLLVSHSLRLKGFAGVGTIAATWRIQEPTVGRHLDALAAAGHARERTGKVAGWTLTAEGRAQHAASLAAEIDAAGCRSAVDAAYRRFITLNQPLLNTCTDWQLRSGTEELNDHRDHAYDAEVIERLVAIDDDIRPVLAALLAELDRFGVYEERFANARVKVQSGDHEWFTGAMIDSYHTIWFELHEDLLATLGIERSKEGA
jgi:hypothetical protein